MGTQSWRVEWRACPQPDGAARLAQAVRLVLEAGTRPSESGAGQTAPRRRTPRGGGSIGRGETR
jgi:hypothetical protein